MGGANGRWPVILLIYGLSVMGVMVVSEGAPALGGIAAEFHPRSPALIGWVMSMPALVAAVAALAIGWLVDRLGDRAVLLGGGLILLAGDGGVVMAPTLGVLLGFRIVGGLGYVCMAVAAVTMMTRVTQGAARTNALALWSTVIPASFILAFGSGALLHGTGWRGLFGAHALLTAALLAIGAVALPGREAGAAAPSRTSGVGVVLRSPFPYLLGLSFAAGAFLQTGMIAVLPRFLDLRIGASEAEVHSFSILAMLFNVAGAFAVGALLNRRVPAWAIGGGGAAIAALSTLALVLAASDLSTAIALNCGIMLGCGVLAGMWALMPRVAPSPRTIGATSGLITQVTLLGVLFGPPAAFAALGAGTTGFVLLVGVTVLGTLAALPVWLRTMRQVSATGGSATLAGSLH